MNVSRGVLQLNRAVGGAEIHVACPALQLDSAVGTHRLDRAVDLVNFDRTVGRAEVRVNGARARYFVAHSNAGANRRPGVLLIDVNLVFVSFNVNLDLLGKFFRRRFAGRTDFFPGVNRHLILIRTTEQDGAIVRLGLDQRDTGGVKRPVLLFRVFRARTKQGSDPVKPRPTPPAWPLSRKGLEQPFGFLGRNLAFGQHFQDFFSFFMHRSCLL